VAQTEGFAESESNNLNCEG